MVNPPGYKKSTQKWKIHPDIKNPPGPVISGRFFYIWGYFYFWTDFLYPGGFLYPGRFFNIRAILLYQTGN